MKGGKRPPGYTIVEVMIVLAISGMMFLIAANFINGKQERAAFTQGSTDLGSQLQAVVEDVLNGHFSDIPLNCTGSASGLTFGGTPKLQGTNPTCVFLGKIVHFYGSPTENFETISLADYRKNVKAIGANNTTVTAVPDLTGQNVIPQRLRVSAMRVVDAGGGNVDDVYNIGFTQGLGSINPATGTYQSGTQNVSLIYADNLNAASGNSPVINTIVRGLHVKLAQSASFCLTDDRRAAKVFIGGSGAGGNQLTVEVKQLGTASCTIP